MSRGQTEFPMSPTPAQGEVPLPSYFGHASWANRRRSSGCGSERASSSTTSFVYDRDSLRCHDRPDAAESADEESGVCGNEVDEPDAAAGRAASWKREVRSGEGRSPPVVPPAAAAGRVHPSPTTGTSGCRPSGSAGAESANVSERESCGDAASKQTTAAASVGTSGDERAMELPACMAASPIFLPIPEQPPAEHGDFRRTAKEVRRFRPERRSLCLAGFAIVFLAALGIALAFLLSADGRQQTQTKGIEDIIPTSTLSSTSNSTALPSSSTSTSISPFAFTSLPSSWMLTPTKPLTSTSISSSSTSSLSLASTSTTTPSTLLECVNKHVANIFVHFKGEGETEETSHPGKGTVIAQIELDPAHRQCGKEGVPLDFSIAGGLGAGRRSTEQTDEEGTARFEFDSCPGGSGIVVEACTVDDSLVCDEDSLYLPECTWKQVGLDIHGKYPGERFDSTVSISADGKRVAMGGTFLPGERPMGLVQVLKETSGRWEPLGEVVTFDDPNVWGGDSAVLHSLALSSDGDWLAIGALGGRGSEFVQMLQYSSGAWSPVGNNLLGKSTPWEKFGHSVALSVSGDRVAVGAPGWGSRRGYTRIFGWNITSMEWNKIGGDIDGQFAGDESGFSVALSASGERVAIGSKNNGGYGHTRMFEFIAGSWREVFFGGWNDNHGFSVSLDAEGNRLAVGAPSESRGALRNGNVFVYHLSEASLWLEDDQMSREASSDQFGHSVSLSGDGMKLAVGAPAYNDGGRSIGGHAIVYEYSSAGKPQRAASLIQIGSDIVGEEEGENLGHSVALSRDGSRVALGGIKTDIEERSDGRMEVRRTGFCRVLQLESSNPWPTRRM